MSASGISFLVQPKAFRNQYHNICCLLCASSVGVLGVGVAGSLSEKCPWGQLVKSPTEHTSAKWLPCHLSLLARVTAGRSDYPKGRGNKQPTTHTQTTQGHSNHYAVQLQQTDGTNHVPGWVGVTCTTSLLVHGMSSGGPRERGKVSHGSQEPSTAGGGRPKTPRGI